MIHRDEAQVALLFATNDQRSIFPNHPNYGVVAKTWISEYGLVSVEQTVAT